MKNCLGIEIGHYRIKIAYAEKGELKEFILIFYFVYIRNGEIKEAEYFEK